MNTPDRQRLGLPEGVLHEGGPDGDPITLWVPGRRTDAFQYWERIASVAGPPVEAGNGLCSRAATALGVRQRLLSTFGKLVQRFWGKPPARSWTLPTGERAEPGGERPTDVLLVWRAGEAGPLDEDSVRARWPDSNRVQRLGTNLFVVAVPAPPPPAQPPLPSAGDPLEHAEQFLAAARQAGERGKEASALADLGVARLRDGDPRRAVALLEEALGIVRALGDRAREMDVLDNLGLAVLAAGQPARALELLEQVRGAAQQAGDRFQEKMTLEHLAVAYSAVRDAARTRAALERALALTREVGDRQHQADLLWFLAILHADVGQRDRAVAQAEAAIDLFQEMGNPHVSMLADHLQRYRQGSADARLGGGEAGPASRPEALFGTWTVTTAVPSPPSGAQPAASGPGLLRMAFSAMKAMSKFIASGMKTVTAATQQQRLQTCATCEHHTGVRCKLCGCFTAVKARLPHERCPIGKWLAAPR
jgi:tetratricopeptide (TPR) repeat protein